MTVTDGFEKNRERKRNYIEESGEKYGLRQMCNYEGSAC